MFFKKKSKSTKDINLQQPTRYEGKPMLRILELYVLDAIGHLPSEDKAKMVKLTPKLAKSFSQTGNWQEIVSKTMEFPDSMPDSIREMWNKNSKIAKDTNQQLSSQKFAEMFVDTNLI